VLGVDNNNDVPRPVHFADFLVALSGFVNKVWEQFSNDLETIEEDTDGR
jgi:hypothetical protein